MAEYIEWEGEKLHAVNFLDKIGLSAHALICPDGSIIKCRDDNQGAYHAKRHNKNSLAIELLVEGTHDYVSFLKTIEDYYLTFEQHIALVELLRDWANTYNILPAYIKTHSELDPSRKKDPGKIPLKQILIDVKAGLKDRKGEK